MTPSRSIQSAAFALALMITLATLGSLNLLAHDQQISAHQAHQAQARAAQPVATVQASTAQPAG